MSLLGCFGFLKFRKTRGPPEREYVRRSVIITRVCIVIIRVIMLLPCRVYIVITRPGFVALLTRFILL